MSSIPTNAPEWQLEPFSPLSNYPDFICKEAFYFTSYLNFVKSEELISAVCLTQKRIVEHLHRWIDEKDSNKLRRLREQYKNQAVNQDASLILTASTIKNKLMKLDCPFWDFQCWPTLKNCPEAYSRDLRWYLGEFVHRYIVYDTKHYRDLLAEEYFN